MKTLILLLAAAIAAPAYAQDSSYETNTTGTSSSYGTPSGSSTTMEEETTGDESQLSGTSTIEEEETTYEETTTTTPSSTFSGSTSESPESMSGTATGSATSTSPTTSSPTMAAPAGTGTATAPAATVAPTPTTAETTSRTYREDTGGRLMGGGFYLEPAFFGTQQDSTLGVAGANDFDSRGFGADLKLGGHINDTVFLAVDGRYERTEADEKLLDGINTDTWNVGPTVGIQTPYYGARLWGTYILDGSNNPEAAANGLDLRFERPYGWRGGIGVRLAAVSLNLEYEDLTYNRTVVQSAGALGGAVGENTEFSNRATTLSLSFPIAL